MIEELDEVWNPPHSMKVSAAIVKAAKFLGVYNEYVCMVEDLKGSLIQTLEKNAKLRDFMESFIKRHIPRSRLIMADVKVMTLNLIVICLWF